MRKCITEIKVSSNSKKTSPKTNFLFSWDADASFSRFRMFFRIFDILNDPVSAICPFCNTIIHNYKSFRFLSRIFNMVLFCLKNLLKEYFSFSKKYFTVHILGNQSMFFFYMNRKHVQLLYGKITFVYLHCSLLTKLSHLD